MKSMVSLFAIILAVSGTLTSKGASLKPLSIEELSSKSDVVVHGTVTSLTCQRDAGGQIYTSVTLAIGEVWKGNINTNSFRIVHSGGVLGDQFETCSAQVEYRIGEEVVAMLVLNERGEGVTLGLIQGKFEVSSDAKTGEKFAENVFHGGGRANVHAGNNASAAGSASGGYGRLGLVKMKQQVKGGAK
jgi:hypothetical protein